MFLIGPDETITDLFYKLLRNYNVMYFGLIFHHLPWWYLQCPVQISMCQMVSVPNYSTGERPCSSWQSSFSPDCKFALRLRNNGSSWEKRNHLSSPGLHTMADGQIQANALSSCLWWGWMRGSSCSNVSWRSCLKTPTSLPFLLLCSFCFRHSFSPGCTLPIKHIFLNPCIRVTAGNPT